MQSKIKQAIYDLESDLVTWRRSIHQEPELGFVEYETAKKIIRVLKDTELSLKTEVAKTGVVADLHIDDNLPILALRADMDALPIQEQNEVEYVSQKEGVMHACGHDGHVAILLGTAVILDEFRDHLDTNVRFIFQPAEEGPGGALPMIKEGVLEGVNSIVGLHLNTDLPTGKIEIKDGPFAAAADQIHLEVLGEGGHGSAPHQTVDAIVVAAEIITALQTVVSRKLDPQEAAVISLGKIEGGYRHNVIADCVKLKGTVRTTDPDIREDLPKKIERVIKGVTISHNADYDLGYKFGYPVLMNDSQLVNYLVRILDELVELEGVDRVKKPSMGAEDFAYYCQDVPGAYYRLGAGKFPNYSYPGHHPRFDFDEAALKLGVMTFVETVLNYSKNKGKDS
ncbi:MULTISPECIES: M20 metallopeptidase family protein [unclassified Candidatus Frackibacter]|uniref:M20 metallopeptidase family protein n=1 Tax=unclassified Candidatus Frackibacter TaxID=2648818 RepID=UPI000798968F|nr:MULTISPECIES: amidohydrolase [unclassified Candidatus Frackibacter]KXS41985.1 MAG: amidohydrolase [Candidatus Frackibacter sp. T328-2]